MDMKDAAAAFAALGLENRLEILKLLVAAGPDGMSAGEVVAKVKSKQNSVSSQLKILTQARLIAPERQGRQIIYRADRTTLDELSQLLVKPMGGSARSKKPRPSPPHG
jgi:DNA-binding transcriptional ArsR family regulator